MEDNGFKLVVKRRHRKCINRRAAPHKLEAAYSNYGPDREFSVVVSEILSAVDQLRPRLMFGTVLGSSTKTKKLLAQRVR